MKADLENIPENLNELYLDVIKRIDMNGDKGLAILILSWLYYTPVPITMSQLQVALAVEDSNCQVEEEDLHDPETLLGCCQGLVVYYPSTGAVQFTHYTIQDFLKQYKDIQSAVDLAKTLLSYLVFDAYKVMEVDCYWRDLNLMQNFRLYASDHWVH